MPGRREEVGESDRRIAREDRVKEAAPSDFHTNSRAAGNHSEIKVIHHPRDSFYSATPT